MSREHTIYQPLDPDGGIRVLILEPGSNNAQICCRIVPENLNHNPEYKALSYEWGSPENSRTITLSGQYVSVRQNLWSALWHLRKNGRIGRLWVDALCINQDDERERGHHVSMMGSIYRKAEVICWLGEGDPTGKHVRAVKYFETMSSEIDTEVVTYLRRHGWTQ